MRKIKTEYEKRLPHYHPVGAVFFVTFRLYGSVPKVALQKLKDSYSEQIERITFDREPFKRERLEVAQQEYFLKFDELLHVVKNGPTWLKQPEIAVLVEEQLKRYDGQYYDLICYTIMSNHVHVIFDTGVQVPLDFDPESNEDFGYVQVDKIMKKIKGPVAVYANRILGRQGAFWTPESYDRYIRDAKELRNKIFYTINNPWKAGLVDDWKEWPFTYLKGAEA